MKVAMKPTDAYFLYLAFSDPTYLRYLPILVDSRRYPRVPAWMDREDRRAECDRLIYKMQ